MGRTRSGAGPCGGGGAAARYSSSLRVLAGPGNWIASRSLGPLIADIDRGHRISSNLSPLQLGLPSRVSRAETAKLCRLSTQLATLAMQLASLLLNTSGSDAHCCSKPGNLRSRSIRITLVQRVWLLDVLQNFAQHIVLQCLKGATGAEAGVQTHGRGELQTRVLKAGMAGPHEKWPPNEGGKRQLEPSGRRCYPRCPPRMSLRCSSGARFTSNFSFCKFSVSLPGRGSSATGRLDTQMDPG